MPRKLLTLLAALWAAASWAAVDVNTATEAELDGIKGIGPGLSGRILQERQAAPFKDWADFTSRVGGVGAKSAANLSQEGLTVNGQTHAAAAAAKPRAKARRPASASESTAGELPGSGDAAAAPPTARASSTRQ